MEPNELAAIGEECRRGQSTTPPTPSRLCELQAQVVSRLESPEYVAEAEKHAADQKRAETERAAAEIKLRRADLWRDRGRLYEHCTLENFQATVPAQVDVLERLRAYGGTLAEKVAAGIGIVLTGPSGTGKDHLFAALFEATLRLGFTLKWTSGAKLFMRFRDRIGGIDAVAEARMIREYTDPDVLVLSDPMPVIGALTTYQAQVLYDISDTRCNHAKATWVTINASGREEAESRLGPQIVRRLCDRALSLACNWARYEKA